MLFAAVRVRSWPNHAIQADRTTAGFHPKAAESASPAWRPLSRTAALGGPGRNGRKAAMKSVGVGRPAFPKERPFARNSYNLSTN